ncbi:MAG: glyoxalase [Gammaproteobacteria bacterium]|nr:MAG: glyoxalase [Gammaproteobacteria bacterium]
MRNPIGWVEIATTDLERAKTFYEKVFGLNFQLVEMPGQKMYTFGACDPNAAGSAGALVQSDDNTPSQDGSMVYFSCEDLSVELARVEEAGGKIMVPKTDIGEFGFFAHVIDTEENKIGLHSQK